MLSWKGCIMMKSGLRRKAQLLIYHLVSVPTVLKQEIKGPVLTNKSCVLMANQYNAIIIAVQVNYLTQTSQMKSILNLTQQF